MCGFFVRMIGFLLGNLAVHSFGILINRIKPISYIFKLRMACIKVKTNNIEVLLCLSQNTIQKNSL